MTKPEDDNTAVDQCHSVLSADKMQQGDYRQYDQYSVRDQIARSRCLPSPFLLVCHFKFPLMDSYGFHEHRYDEIRGQDRIYNLAPPHIPDISTEIFHGDTVGQMGRKPEQKKFPESALYEPEPGQSEQDWCKDKDHPAQKCPPVQICIQIGQSCSQWQFPCKDRVCILYTLDHTSRPAHSLSDHTFHCGS